MKRDEILGMKPGRELDALVAEKVMGWRKCTVEGWREKRTYGLPPDFDDSDEIVRIDEFSTDISAAWKVVGKMKGTATWYGIESHAPGHRAVFRVKSQRVDEGWYEAVTESAPEAICKAALIAVLEESQ